MLRVPCVRRCLLDFEDGSSREDFMVNLSVLGAYVALDDPPPIGSRVTCRFRLGAGHPELALAGVVTRVNTRQQHPVHSLPAGFGVRFLDPTQAALDRIARYVSEHVRRHPNALS
jgi:hypothetical protein